MFLAVSLNILIFNFFGAFATGNAGQQNGGEKTNHANCSVERNNLSVGARRSAVGKERSAADAVLVNGIAFHIEYLVEVMFRVVFVGIGMGFHCRLRMRSLSGVMPGQPSGLLNVSYQTSGIWS